MREITWACTIFVVLAWSLRAGAEPAPRLRIFASVLPVQSLVQEVAGDDVRVDVMVLPGQSPATYEPTAQQVASLAQADLFVRVGVPFENAWMRRIAAANPRMKILDLRDGLTLRRLEEHSHHHENQSAAGPGGAATEHADEALDPHLWTNPRMVRRMAAGIRDQLIELDPEHATGYRERQQVLDQTLRRLDQALSDILRNSNNQAFLVYHPAWGYFADAYGLRQVPVEFEGKEPGARRLTALIDQARNLGIQVVVVQPQFNHRSADRIAQAIGGRVAIVDPLSVDYGKNLLELARLIAGADQSSASEQKPPSDR